MADIEQMSTQKHD